MIEFVMVYDSGKQRRVLIAATMIKEVRESDNGLTNLFLLGDGQSGSPVCRTVAGSYEEVRDKVLAARNPKSLRREG